MDGNYHYPKKREEVRYQNVSLLIATLRGIATCGLPLTRVPFRATPAGRAR